MSHKRYAVNFIDEEGEFIPLAVLEEGSLETIEYIHSKVHEGEMYFVDYSASVDNNASLNLQMITGEESAHVVLNAFCGGQANLYVFEEITSTGGTAVTCYNMNRGSSKVCGAAFAHTPTVSDTGTAIVDGRLLPGGATQQTRAGVSQRAGTEFVLKPDTKYLIRLTNTSGSTVALGVEVEFYEED